MVEKQVGATDVAKAKDSKDKAVVSDSSVMQVDYFADFDFNSIQLSLESMLKAGVHFGHMKSRRHPKMNRFIYTTRNGLAIINLEETLERAKEAARFLAGVQKSGKSILVVATKKQAHDTARSFARRMKFPFVIDRWIGGTFTNFSVIRSRAKYLRDTSEKLEKGEFGRYTKFERMKIAEEMGKLEQRMGGIKYMEELPGAVLLADAKESGIVIHEAKRAHIPIVGIADTNADPSDIDYPVPANDDAVSSLRLLFGFFGKEILSGSEAEKELQKK